MSRAQDLFEQLKSGGLAALDKLIDDREPESLFLDFKGTKDIGTSQKLNDDDSKNVSKGISGFGNSSGGVLVWGVDCRRDSSGVEVVTKQCLSNIQGFQGKIESAISRLTLPPHTGVQTVVIPDAANTDKGYLVVLVPQSMTGPIRATATNHYHIRAGSNFEIIGHDVLAGMFGRTPQPRIEMNFIGHGTVLDQSNTWLHIPLTVVAVNIGSVIAERPYLSIWLRNFPKEHFQWKCLRPDDYVLRSGYLPGFSMVARNGICVPPNATEDLCTMTLEIPVRHVREVNIEFTVGANGTAPTKCTVRGSADSMTAAITKLESGVGSLSTDLLKFDV